jgi:hypothetical protein
VEDVTVKTKLKNTIGDLPEEIAAQVYDYAMYLKQKMLEERELEQLSRSAAFRRLSRGALKEIRNKELLSLDELKKEIKR